MLKYPEVPPEPFASWARAECMDYLSELGVQFDPMQSLDDLRRRAYNEATKGRVRQWKDTF